MTMPLPIVTINDNFIKQIFVALIHQVLEIECLIEKGILV